MQLNRRTCAPLLQLAEPLPVAAPTKQNSPLWITVSKLPIAKRGAEQNVIVAENHGENANITSIRRFASTASAALDPNSNVQHSTWLKQIHITFNTNMTYPSRIQECQDVQMTLITGNVDKVFPNIMLKTILNQTQTNEKIPYENISKYATYEA